MRIGVCGDWIGEELEMVWCVLWIMLWGIRVVDDLF